MIYRFPLLLVARANAYKYFVTEVTQLYYYFSNYIGIVVT